MKMRKIVAIVLSLILTVSCVTGCGQKEKVPETVPGTEDTQETSKTPETLPQIETDEQKDDTEITIPQKEKPSIPGLEEADSTEDDIGQPGVDFKLLETGAADDWGEEPIPGYNPVGSRSLYSDVVYDEEEKVHTFTILDGYTPKSVEITGTSWELAFADGEASLAWMKYCAREMGGVIYPSAGDRAIFYIQDENDGYWCIGNTEYGPRCKVVHIKTASQGHALTLETSQENGQTLFYTECTPGKLQTVTVGLRAGKATLTAFQESSYGDGLQNINRSWVLDASKYQTYVLDDIPIVEGQLTWTLAWGNDVPQDVTFEIEDTADIEPVTWGDDMGALKVSGIPMGSVSIWPQNGLQYTDTVTGYTAQGGFALQTEGVVQPDGSILTALPAGYYEVRFGDGLSIEAQGAQQLVAVSAGQITEIEIPKELMVTYQNLSKLYANFETSEGSLQILSVTEEDSNAVAEVLLNDPLHRDILPTPEEVNITENGEAAKVLSVERAEAQADVVLVLDTSGSMKNSMQAAVDAAKRFVENLPDGTNIRLLQFAQKITQHPGEGKEKVIAALDSVQAVGGTALYDATSKALSMLEGYESPYVVVFSDGADSKELVNAGKGSDLDREDIIAQIKDSGMTVLTIGFGAGHDPGILIEMSEASEGGGYFAAADQSALDSAFASVAGQFGNQYTITYERPKASAANSQVPVVAFTVDASGSMEQQRDESVFLTMGTSDQTTEDPEALAGGESPDPVIWDRGYRLDTAKALLHDAIVALPEDTLLQFGSFQSENGMIYAPYGQITTNDKAAVLKALGSLTPGGDTEGLENDSKTIQLTVTLRDFKDGGQVFGVWSGGKGYVEKQLGADRKPVYITEKWEKDGVTDTDLLQYCFNDKPGYNMSMEYELVLESDEAGNFSVDYTSWNEELAETMPEPLGFFPLDDLLYGNEGSVHNYLFSAEIHTQFTYYEGATFSFTGDDDVWVYIDDTLVVDLGGVHSAEDAHISLDELVADGTLDITPGEVVNFDFFFMERMPSESNMLIQTNFDFVVETEGSRIQAKGTPLLQGLQSASAILEPVPSDKRTLVVLTDGALDMGGIATQQKQRDEQLEKLKKAGYNVLFVGIGDEAYAAAMDPIFQETAEKAGGAYIITQDAAQLTDKIKEIAGKANTPEVKEDSISVTVEFDCNAADGSWAAYYTAQDVKGLMAVSESSAGGTITEPSMVKITKGGKYEPYRPETAELLTGGDTPKEETIISLHMPLEADQSKTETLNTSGIWAENELVRFTVTDAYFMDMFKGIAAPSGKQFLAVNTLIQWNNQTDKDYTAYQVPTILNHFYACVNGVMAQASEATWLSESPLTVPGNPQLEVAADTAVSGAIVFMVDRNDGEEISQFSLHFYDTVHGHVTIPVCGSAPEHLAEITQLPTSEPAKISEAFELTVSGSTEETQIGGISTSKDQKIENVFRIVEGQFGSKVQALLDIDPQQRFLFAVETDQGPLAVKMSNVVYSMPLGFTGSAYLAPGSKTAVRIPFELPKGLTGAASYIYADLSSGTVELSVTTGSAYKTGSLGQTFSHEYFDLTINGFYPVESGSDLLVLDFTIKDKQDGYGTGGIASLFSMTDTAAMDEKTQAAVLLSGRGTALEQGELNDGLYYEADIQKTLEYLYGAVEEENDWGVLDNYTRRGLLFFDGSQISGKKYITSAFFENMSIPLSEEAYPYPELLTKKTYVNRNLDFERALAEAVSAAISEYETTRSAAPEVTVMEPEGGKLVNTPSPALTVYGSRLLDSVSTEEELLQLLYGVEIKMSDTYIEEGNQYLYAPESTLTQGWGSQYDVAMLAVEGFSKLGYEPKLRTVKTNSDGRYAVEEMTVGGYCPDYVPAVQYKDPDGKDQLLVIPFLRELQEVKTLCYLPYEEPDMIIEPMTGILTVTINAEVTDSQATGQMQLFGDMFGALAGEGEEEGTEPEPVYETVQLLEKEISLPDIGKDFLDLSFLEAAKSDKNNASVVIAAIETREGLLSSPDQYIDLGVYRADSVTTTLQITDQWGSINEYASTTHPLPKDQNLTEVMQSFAIGVPEFSGAAEEVLEAAVDMNAESAQSTNSSNYSISRWMAHSTLQRLVKGLTDYDRDNADRLRVETGRITEPLVLGVTMRSDGKEAKVFVDLMHHDNQILDYEDGGARNGYVAGLGMAASQLEASAVPGGGIGYLDVWAALPEDAQIIPYYSDYSEDAEALAKQLASAGYPTVLTEHMIREYGNTIFIVPTSSAVVNGEAHWAWLEIDTDTYSTVSVFETGERSGLAGFVMGLVPKNLAEPTAGVLVGVSTSMWAISSYSLETEDYAEVLVESKALCQYISSMMKAVTGARDIAENLNDLKEKVGELDGFTGDNFEPAIAKLTRYLATLGGNNLVGATGAVPSSFVDGFDLAVDYYFEGVPD